jgi:hypothetical protein
MKYQPQICNISFGNLGIIIFNKNLACKTKEALNLKDSSLQTTF